MLDNSELDSRVPRWRELVHAARLARNNAYAPYSKFCVGAAILADDGRIFVGCNVENASYGLTICAERAAVCQAVASGCRKMVAVCVSLAGKPSPCGACRQVLWQFGSEMQVIMDNVESPVDCVPAVISLSALLPSAFQL
jgi:cytidine deaminase